MTYRLIKLIPPRWLTIYHCSTTCLLSNHHYNQNPQKPRVSKTLVPPNLDRRLHPKLMVFGTPETHNCHGLIYNVIIMFIRTPYNLNLVSILTK